MGGSVKQKVENLGIALTFIIETHRSDYSDVWEGTKQNGGASENPWESIIKGEINEIRKPRN